VSEVPAPAPQPARVFFALWPDASIQALLLERARELHRRLGGKLTRQESIHLTLVFLGDVALDRLPLLNDAAAAARFQPFSIEVEQAGCWQHNGVAWLAPRRTPDALLALVQTLEAALSNAGFSLDARPYAPHITVLRKARCKRLDLEFDPVAWPVADFVLVRSQLDAAGSRYSVVGRWPDSPSGPQ